MVIKFKQFHLQKQQTGKNFIFLNFLKFFLINLIKNRFGVHYIVENYVCFLCVSTDSTLDKTCYSFLKNLKVDYFSTLQMNL